MVCDAKKTFVEPAAECNLDNEAVEMIAEMENIFNGVGLKYGRDFVFKAVEGEKLRFCFSDKDSLNLAIKALRGE